MAKIYHIATPEYFKIFDKEVNKTYKISSFSEDLSPKLRCYF